MGSANERDTSSYFRGEELIGDAYSADEIRLWFADEASGYANLGAKDRDSYSYSYHALICFHAFSHLPDRRVTNALGIGSAYGHEFQPILDLIEKITILDPSDHFKVSEIEGIPITYRKPHPLGHIEFPDDTFDLITCFAVLHHIPNVSFVVQEMGRVLRKGSFLLMREPCVSMGDWRMPRSGLTKRERGIPETIMHTALRNVGFEVVSKTHCNFSPIPRLAKMVGIADIYNSKAITRLDAVASKLFSRNNRYHRT